MSTKRMSDTINIGAADIFFTPEDTGVPIYLGLTKGGATFEYESQWHELTADQVGNTPLDDVLIGEKAKLTVEILDTTLEKINSLFPASSMENDNATTFGRRAGLRATHHSGVIRVHPVSLPIDDTSQDLYIYRTTNTGKLSLAYKLDEEWKIPCEFKAYFDDKRKEGDRLFRIGEYKDTSMDESNKRIVNFWLTPKNPIKEVGDTVEFRANAMFEDGSTEDVTKECKWSTTDEEILSLELDGDVLKVKAKKTGKAIVYVEFLGRAISTVVVVE